MAESFTKRAFPDRSFTDRIGEIINSETLAPTEKRDALQQLCAMMKMEIEENQKTLAANQSLIHSYDEEIAENERKLAGLTEIVDKFGRITGQSE
jgi:hypothetical protein